MQSIKTKNCLVPPGREPRFDAALGDKVYYKAENGPIAEGVIRSIADDGNSVTLVQTGEDVGRHIPTASIIALVLSD